MYLFNGVEHCSIELSSTKVVITKVIIMIYTCLMGWSIVLWSSTKMACTRIVTIVGTCLWDGLFFRGANLNKNGMYQNNNKSMHLSNGVEHCSMELSSTRAAGNGIFSSSLTRSSRKLTLCLNNKIVLLM